MKRILGVILLTILLAACQPKTEEPTAVVTTPSEPVIETPVVEVEPEPIVETKEPDQVIIPPIETPIEVELPIEGVETLEPAVMGASNHLNRDYEWYIDQETTGDHAYDNCGPASTVMAMKWYNPDLTNTVEDARAAYRPEGGWWFTTDIEAYLGENGVPMEYADFNTAEDIVGYIDSGKIVIICLDTGLLPYEPNDLLKMGKFYDDGFGHFIVGKGYQYLDDKLYIEVYDPWSLGMTYPNGEPKGKDRLYAADELTKAIEEWWDYLIIIG